MATDLAFMLALTGGDVSILNELTIPYIAVVDDPEYQAFFGKLSDEDKKWLLESYIPVATELSTVGFGLELGNLDRYVIELLGVKVEHRRRGIGGRLIKQVIDAAKADPKVGKAGVISSEVGVFAYNHKE
ncbi:hypothetical protein M422DRAFT_44490 [Sphaerobolus stellatus SS14]|nr:hypothetical protein M422DRAFT_44490 [Sphaerobolus stellatus SS14]